MSSYARVLAVLLCSLFFISGVKAAPAASRVPLGAGAGTIPFVIDTLDKTSGFYYAGQTFNLQNEQAIALRLENVPFSFKLQVMNPAGKVIKDKNFECKKGTNASGSVMFQAETNGVHSYFIIQAAGSGGKGELVYSMLGAPQMTLDTNYTFRERFNLFFSHALTRFVFAPMLGTQWLFGYMIDYGMANGTVSSASFGQLMNIVYRGTNQAKAKYTYDHFLPQFKACCDPKFFTWTEDVPGTDIAGTEHFNRSTIQEFKAPKNTLGTVRKSVLSFYKEKTDYLVVFFFYE